MSEQNTLAIRQEPSLFNITSLVEANEFSSQMSKAKLIPAHLQNSPSDCLRVVMQAAKWGMDPFAVADKTSVISGKLMYEGQLVAAVINSRAKLSKRLSYAFVGAGAQRVLTVSGTPAGETEPLTIELTYSQALAINKNGQMQRNPDQQMCYIGARIWARRHMPELMLGVTAADEIPEDAPMENVTGTGDAAPVTVADPVPPRQAPPPRAKKGAAAVVQNADAPKPVEPVIETTATPVAPTPPAPVAVATPTPPAPVVEPTPVVAETPAAAALKTTLADNEQFAGIVRVVSSKGMLFLRKGVPNSAGVCAEVDGAYKGVVYHEGGGVADKPITDKDVVVVPSPLWTIGNTLNVKLIGRMPVGAKAALVRVLEATEATAAVDAAAELE